VCCVGVEVFIDSGLNKISLTCGTHHVFFADSTHPTSNPTSFGRNITKSEYSPAAREDGRRDHRALHEQEKRSPIAPVNAYSLEMQDGTKPIRLSAAEFKTVLTTDW
jgi:hypothetical protein